MQLKNKTALVTGASGGIGRAIVKRFTKEGAKVYATDIKSAGQVIKLDVTNEAEIKQLMQKTKKLDIVVNAAGVEIEKSIENTSLGEWNKIFAINCTGTFLVCKYALPLLKKSKSASIINFGSYDGFIADPNLAAYCATKGAVHALTKAMACDHGRDGIRVNAICPGYIDTPMLKSFFQNGNEKKLKDEAKNIHPLKTYGKPKDVANLVLWLASNEALYATGQLWILDGGLTAQAQQMRI